MTDQQQSGSKLTGGQQKQLQGAGAADEQHEQSAQKQPTNMFGNLSPAPAPSSGMSHSRRR
jgi:hypothetical protein